MTGRIENCQDISIIAPILHVLRGAMDRDLFDQRLAQALDNGYRTFVTDTHSGLLGYHITHDVFWGKTFYIDDLVVLRDLRSSGIGAALLDHANRAARQQGCDHIRLCSGLSRYDAHRFYEANGFARSSLQFSHSLIEGTV